MKNNKGFTLIELMIVIAIIAIIAAIAIPNLMASRVRANEATAISAIKQIATAQVTFQAGRQGRAGNTSGGNNGYCDNYRNLAFSPPVGGTADSDKLALVSDVVANASIDAAGGGSTAVVGSDSGVGVGGGALDDPYQGYFFNGDPDIEANDEWDSDFACYAVPSLGGTSGNNNYWVGQQGAVYIDGVAPDTAAAAIADGDTPQEGGVVGTWTTL